MPPPRPVNLPKNITPELAYLIGAILGDGTIQKPLKRKRGGYYWDIEITSNKEYSILIEKVCENIFKIKANTFQDKRKKDCWHVSMHSKAVHNYFTEVVGITAGRKTGNIPWIKECCNTNELFKHFLAGLIDTDGHVSKRYICLVQKDKEFLEKIKINAKEILDIDFRGPIVNRKIDGNVVGWMISIYKGDEKRNFLNTIPLRYKRLL